MKRRLILIPIAATFAALEPAASADLTAPEVTVTAPHAAPALTLTAPGIDTARERIDMTPGGAGVVDAEEYKTGRTSTVQDALGLAPGVFIQSRIPGGAEARLSIRGSGIQRTFHLRGIKLMQDGVPLNQADGAADFQALEPLAARYVEIFRGANALASGSTTLGGSVNYVSYTGYDAAPLQLRAEAGSYGYMRGQISGGVVHEKMDGYASASHFTLDGFQDHSQQDEAKLFANLGLRLNEQLETRFYVLDVNADSELPGALTKAQLDANPRQANPGNVAGNQKRDFDLNRVANRTTYNFGDARIEVGTWIAHKRLFHPIFQVLDIVSDDYGMDLRYVSEAPLLGRRNLLTIGFSPALTDQTDNRFANVGGTRGARTAASDQTATNLDLYFEDQHYVGERDALVVGAQASRSSRKYEDHFLANGDNSFDSDYEAISPKFGWRHEFSPQVQAFANVSRSFEPPSFGELAGGPGITQVSAQKADTLEIGSRGNLTDLTWDAALYYAKVRDELLGLNDANGNPLGTVNAPHTLHVGAELGVTKRLSNIELRAAYLWNDFRFDGDPVYGNNTLPGIPKHFFKGEALYRFASGFYIGPTAEWSPQRYPVDMANTLFADSYALFGLKLGSQSKTGLSWFVEGRNLSNQKYAATTNVIANAKGADSAQFNPGEGRGVYAGVEWKL
ncbi:MAG: TonB-dependent receptor [Betaproteobacteria bacterium]